MDPGNDDACRHDYRPNVGGWFFSGTDLHREYACVHCGQVVLMGPGEYDRFTYWEGE